jgi:transposase InsO family protein
MKQLYPRIGLQRLCGLFGYGRQSYYKRQIREEKLAFKSALIVDLVREIRQNIARIGGKKLYFMLRPQLSRHQLKIGRDAFFEVLRANDLLIRRRKRRAVTTWSKHGLRTYPNLIQELIPLRPNELWVSDITYIRVGDVWHYVIFITDAYSHMVVGHNVGANMDAEFCVQALKQALDQWKDREGTLIHHSDRGLQYCSVLYTKKLLGNHIQISMTQHGDPLENAIAERVNGIFKEDFEMHQNFENLPIAVSEIQNMVYHYNYTRPHASCDYLTPAQAHSKTGPLPKRW